tara:strand:+ start:700 stop:2079 length:1380 start_codon:yes stop_codon:yes gene_type:complete
MKTSIDRILLNGTDSSSTDANSLVLYDDTTVTFGLLLDGTDSSSSDIGDDILLNGTDSSFTDAGGKIELETETTATDFDVVSNLNKSTVGGSVLLEEPTLTAPEFEASVIKPRVNNITGVADKIIVENALISGTDNKIINGNFAVNQRSDDQSETLTYTAATTPANSDDTYLFDRWKLLSDGNDIVDVHSYGRTMGSRDFGTNSGPPWMPAETGFAMAMEVETGDKKFGQAQFIESMNCNDLRGQTCTLSWKARTTSSQSSPTSIKAAVIGWFGTSDTITSDIISAWNSEGTDPTLVANAEYLNVPSNILLNPTMKTYSLKVNVPVGIKNVIVFIWNDMSDGDVGTTVGDFIFLSDVQLERGDFENPRFQNEPYDITEGKCHRYYYKATGTHYGQVYSTSSGFVNARMSHQMRVTPTIVRYSSVRTTTGLAYYNNRIKTQVLMTSTAPFITNLEVDAEL